MERAVLLIQCPDRKGIVARLTGFLFENDANIVGSSQHTTHPEGGRFFMRLEFDFDPNTLSKDSLQRRLDRLAQSLHAQWEIHYASTVMRMGIAVSLHDHCLVDILYRVSSGELKAQVPLIVSNHDKVRKVAEDYGIPFYHLPIVKDKKAEQEKALLKLVRNTTDFLVLARYMQILSEHFLNEYGKDIINIHHSFLPSFKGANPYQQAYDRGVKLIGATAHFATVELDEGPIIEQVVDRVSHRDSVERIKQKSKTLEQIALARAIQAYLEHRIIRYENKTIVFD